MLVRRIQHVTLAVQSTSAAETVGFYRDVLGFPMRPVPQTLRTQPNIVAWFQVGDDEIHLMAESDPRNGASRRHLCLQVEDLDAARQTLEDNGYQTESATPIPGRPRFFCHDPAGNLLEFTMMDEAAS